MSDDKDSKPEICKQCIYFQYRMSWNHNGICCAEREIIKRNAEDIACRHGKLR